MDEAGQSRSRYVRIADRASRLYAPAVHSLAALAFVGWMIAGAGWHQSLVIAIAVLIITCPCAMGLAVPAAQVVASGALIRRGPAGQGRQRAGTAGRSRHRAVRQDRHADAGRAARRHRRAFGRGEERSRSPWRRPAAIRSASASRNRLMARRDRARSGNRHQRDRQAAASPGRIGMQEVALERPQAGRRRSSGAICASAMTRPLITFADRLRPDAPRLRWRGFAADGRRCQHRFGRQRRRRGARGRGARHPRPGRHRIPRASWRSLESLKAAWPPPADGGRRAERRPRAGRRACLHRARHRQRCQPAGCRRGVHRRKADAGGAGGAGRAPHDGGRAAELRLRHRL